MTSKASAISPAPPEAPTVEHPWQAWTAKFMRFQHKFSKEGHRSGVEQILKDFGAAAGYPDVREMTKDRFREVWDAVEVGKAPKTQANWLGTLSGFARFLEEELEGYPGDFTRGVRRPPKANFGTRHEIYEEKWFQPIWTESPLWFRPVWEDHWFTGMDTKDLWELQPRKHLLKVETPSQEKGQPPVSSWKVWKVRAKEGELIDQPLNSRIISRWVETYEKSGPEGYLHAEAHRRYSDEKSWSNQCRNALHAAQERLGLPRLDLKTTRHTFATRHLLRFIRAEKNAPTLDQIRRWLGHAPDSRILERLYIKLMSLPHLMD